MPSELGKFIRAKRTELGIGLREMARLIEKSAPFLTELELDDDPARASEETLRGLARVLKVDPDLLFALANRLPKSLIPETPLEVALYRQVKSMSPAEQRRWLESHKGPRKGR